jgi:hypothetical protein
MTFSIYTTNVRLVTTCNDPRFMTSTSVVVYLLVVGSI